MQVGLPDHPKCACRIAVIFVTYIAYFRLSIGWEECLPMQHLALAKTGRHEIVSKQRFSVRA